MKTTIAMNYALSLSANSQLQKPIQHACMSNVILINYLKSLMYHCLRINK